MKETKRFLAKGFFMMIAVMAVFLFGVADKTCAATGSVVIPVAEFTYDGFIGTDPGYFKDFVQAILWGVSTTHALLHR